jgi:hypothetical protein
MKDLTDALEMTQSLEDGFAISSRGTAVPSCRFRCDVRQAAVISKATEGKEEYWGSVVYPFGKMGFTRSWAAHNVRTGSRDDRSLVGHWTPVSL